MVGATVGTLKEETAKVITGVYTEQSSFRLTPVNNVPDPEGTFVEFTLFEKLKAIPDIVDALKSAVKKSRSRFRPNHALRDLV